MSIFLDNASTTPLSKDHKDYLISILDVFGNPSSIHSEGVISKQIIDDSRISVRKFIGATNPNESDILFTPSGSASNTLAISGFVKQNPSCNIYYSPIAHKSILKCIESCNVDKFPIPVNEYGELDLKWLDTQLNLDAIEYPHEKHLVVVDYGNSEIGTIQDIDKLLKIVHQNDKFYCYLDCTGSIPTIPIDVKKLGSNVMIGFSGHKLGALKGIGVLYKPKNIDLSPIIYGTQEQGLIGGTENLLGIASIGRACEEHDYYSISSQSRDYLWNMIQSEISDCYLVGPSIESGRRLKNNLFIAFSGIEGESLMMLLDMNNIMVSTSSACNSSSLTPSATLIAIGLNQRNYHSCIRISLCEDLTDNDILYVFNTLKKCVNQLRNLK